MMTLMRVMIVPMVIMMIMIMMMMIINDNDDDDESTMMMINDDDSMKPFLNALRYTSTAFLAMFLAGLFELSFVTPSESEQEEEVSSFVTQPPTCVSKVFGLIFGLMLFIVVVVVVVVVVVFFWRGEKYAIQISKSQLIG
jgi:type III secretory pathway component EscU